MSTLDHDTDAQMRRRVADLERTVATLKSQHTESLRLLHDEIGRLQQACALDQLSELIPTDPQSHSQAEMATQTEMHESSLPFLASLTEQLINAEAASTLALSAFASQSSQTTAQFAALFQTLSSQVKERDSVIVQLQETMTERDSQLEAMRALVSKQAVELDAVKKRLATSEAVSTQVKKQLASFVSADVLVRESPRRTVHIKDGSNPSLTATVSQRPRSRIANVIDDQDKDASAPARHPNRSPSAPLPEPVSLALPQRPSVPPPANTTSAHHRQISTSSRRPRSVVSPSANELDAKHAAILPLLQSITAGRASSSQLSTSPSSIRSGRSLQQFGTARESRVDSMMELVPHADPEMLGTAHQVVGELNKTAMLPPIGMSVGLTTAAVGGNSDARHSS